MLLVDLTRVHPHATAYPDFVRIAHLHLWLLLEDPQIDAVVNDLPLTFLYRRMARQPDFKKRLFATFDEMRQRYGKPLLAVVGFSPFEKEEVDLRRELQAAGIPAFHNFERAARAFKHTSDYHRFRKAERGVQSVE